MNLFFFFPLPPIKLLIFQSTYIRTSSLSLNDNHKLIEMVFHCSAIVVPNRANFCQELLFNIAFEFRRRSKAVRARGWLDLVWIPELWFDCIQMEDLEVPRRQRERQTHTCATGKNSSLLEMLSGCCERKVKLSNRSFKYLCLFN